MKKAKVLILTLTSLIALSCGQSNQASKHTSGASTIYASSMVDKEVDNIFLERDLFGSNDKNLRNGSGLFDGLLSLTTSVDEETESMFFNHGSAIGLLPKGIRPSREDSSFTIISETRNPSLVEYNSRSFPNGVRSVVVSSLDFTIDENSRLFKTYNTQADIEKMVIIADTVKISANLKLPATSLTIKAREIILEDKGVIDLSALVVKEQPNQFENGKAGNKSGDLNLLAEKLTVLGNLSNRIILDGGKGQDAGIGKNGSPGRSMPHPVTFRRVKTNPPIESRFPTLVYATTLVSSEKAGTQEWPGDGENATPGGIPGVGGNAGNINHTFSDDSLLKKVVSAKEGLPGLHAPKALGGAPGQPEVAVWYWQQMVNAMKVTEVVTQHRSVKGTDAERTDVIASGKVGIIKENSEKIQDLLNEESFKNALIDQSIIKLRYARSLYMNFYIDEAYTAFIEIVKENKISSNVRIDEVINSATVEITKIQSHLDYYGNESMWFPELSFEINKAFNEKEIESSFDNLYYVYSLKNAQSTVENKMKALENLDKNVKADIEKEQISINDTLEKIPTIQTQFDQIALKEQMIQKELNLIEEEINRSAIRNLTPKKHNQILKAVAAICTVFPAGQPAIGIVGNALPKIMEMGDDDRNWKDIIKTGVGIYNEIKKIDWEASSNNWNEVYGKLINESWKGMNQSQIQERLKSIYNVSKPLIDVIVAQKKAIGNNEAPRSAIEQEITRIKSVHPRYVKVVTLLAEVTEQKQLFVRTLNDLSKKTLNSREVIIGNFIKRSSLSSEYLAVSGNYNPDFSRSLSELEETAKANLLKYRYYFLKSYGYRFLKSPKVNYNPVEVFNKLVGIIEYNKGQELNKEQYTMLKQAFIQDLQPLMTDVLNDIQMGAKTYQTETTLYFSKEELEAISQGQSVIINLKNRDIYSESEEDIRITKISVGKFTMTEPESITNPNLDLDIIHTGRFDLTKDGRSYAFEMAKPSTWTYRYNMVESTGAMKEVAKSFPALIASLLSSFNQTIATNGSLEYFSLMGGNGEMKIKLKDDSFRRLKGATISGLNIKIEYSYSMNE